MNLAYPLHHVYAKERASEVNSTENNLGDIRVRDTDRFEDRGTVL